ncbi:MAG: VOC family protein [Aphanocapsa sp. GSE-SYN-MK-11-07L]|nr:VOC family protein [Aphanocapsa sp. GSE-SYN-MK-11-07L]
MIAEIFAPYLIHDPEVDYYWERLAAGGDDKAQQCGWLKDKYGVSWQIVLRVLGEMLSDTDPERLRDRDSSNLRSRGLRSRIHART